MEIKNAEVAYQEKHIKRTQQNSNILFVNILSVNNVEQEIRCQHDCCKDSEHNVRLCKLEDIKIHEEFVVNYTDPVKQKVIVDNGSPISLARNLRGNELNLELHCWIPINWTFC